MKGFQEKQKKGGGHFFLQKFMSELLGIFIQRFLSPKLTFMHLSMIVVRMVYECVLCALALLRSGWYGGECPGFKHENYTQTYIYIQLVPYAYMSEIQESSG